MLDVATGRALAEVALRQPMRAIGWDPRAAGWFTRQIASGFLGVAALGSASRYSRPGTARIMLHIGIRDEGTEQAVVRLCGVKDEGYRQRTAATGIGYLLPGSSWREWEIRRAPRMRLRAISHRWSGATRSPTCSGCHRTRPSCSRLLRTPRGTWGQREPAGSLCCWPGSWDATRRLPFSGSGSTGLGCELTRPPRLSARWLLVPAGGWRCLSPQADLRGPATARFAPRVRRGRPCARTAWLYLVLDGSASLDG